MKSLHETITAALEAQGVRMSESPWVYDYVDPVVKALEEREFDIADDITATAVDEVGLVKEDAERALAEAGLSVRPEEEEEETGSLDPDPLAEVREHAQQILDLLNRTLP